MIDFFSNGLCTYCNSINRELSRIEKYYKSTEQLWINTTVDIDKKYTNDLTTLKGEERSALGQIYYSELIDTSIIPSIIHNQSIVVTLSSFVEHALHQLCLKLTLIAKTKFKTVKNKSKVLQYMEYLSKELNIKICDHLVKFYQIRNEIVHNSGISSEKFHDTIKEFPREQIKAMANDRIDISSLFILNYLKVIKQYFDTLDYGIKNFIVHINQKTNA